MGENSRIEWTDHTINWWMGCTKISPACDHCYAEAQAARFGLARWGNGEPRVRTKSAVATAFRLDRKAQRLGRRLKVFSNSMSDFFDTEVDDAWRDEAMAVMALTPNLDWLVLTKRPKVMRGYMLERWQGAPAQRIAGMEIPAGGTTGRRGRIEEACQKFLDKLGLADPSKDELWTEDGECRAMQWDWPLPNVSLGVTAEDQKMADLRIPDLLATPAAKRFLSVEPMLGPMVLWHPEIAAAAGDAADAAGIDWVICGGESGPHARPMHPDWPRSLRGQCQATGVPFFFKQWGEWLPGAELHLNERLRHEEATVLPDGRVREWQAGYPEARLTHPGMVSMRRIGKKRAGRLLDGREWNEVP